MGLFGGRHDSLFVNPFKQMTKAPCKFHLLQGACSSPVVCSAPLFLPCSLQDYRLRCLCPGRNAAWPQRAAASCFAQPHVGCGHDALQIRDLTELRRLVGACLKPALPKDALRVPIGAATHAVRGLARAALCCTAQGARSRLDGCARGLRLGVAASWSSLKLTVSPIRSPAIPPAPSIIEGRP